MTLVAAVAAPVIEPPPINLIRSARNPRPNAENGNVDGDVRWTMGFAYLPAGDVALGTFGSFCPGGAAVDLSDVPPNADVVEWFPVTAWAGIRCSAMGWQGIDWQARLKALIAAAMPKAVEHEFWTGATSAANGLGNLALASPRADDLTPAAGAVPLKRAFGLLEQALADCGFGGAGMIHCRPEAVPDFTGVRQEGNVLLTPRDTLVVPGVGYPNTGPDGAAAPAGESWMYATGIPDVRLDTSGPDNGVYFPTDPGNPDDYYRALDRATNTITLRAERMFSASWDGLCHFAVRAALTT